MTQDTAQPPPIDPGTRVIASDGEALGTVRTADDHLLVIGEGPFAGDIYIPRDAVSANHDGTVVLTVSRRQIESMNWTTPPGDRPQTPHPEPLAETERSFDLDHYSSVSTTTSVVDPQQVKDSGPH